MKTKSDAQLSCSSCCKRALRSLAVAKVCPIMNDLSFSIWLFPVLEGWGGEIRNSKNIKSLLALGFKTHKQHSYIPVPLLSNQLGCLKSCAGAGLFVQGIPRADRVAPRLSGSKWESGSAGVRMVPFGWAAIREETVWLLPGASRSCLSSRQFPKPLADFPLRTVHLSGNEIGYGISHVAKPH